MWRRDKDAYQVWLKEKITDRTHVARSHGFRYRGQYEDELAGGEWEIGGQALVSGIPGENAARKGVVPGLHAETAASIVTGIPEAPGA